MRGLAPKEVCEKLSKSEEALGEPFRSGGTAMVMSKALQAVERSYAGLLTGVVELLQQARRTSARSVNAIMTLTYWEIGRRIVEHEQQGKQRAGYGQALIERLATDLTTRFGRGFSQTNLKQMREFYLAWPIRQTLSDESRPGSSSGFGVRDTTDIV